MWRYLKSIGKVSLIQTGLARMVLVLRLVGQVTLPTAADVTVLSLKVERVHVQY